MEIKIKHNFKNINKIINDLPKKISESIEDVLKNIRGYAIKLENGNNSNGIKVELVDVSSGRIEGRVYADPNEFKAYDTNGKEISYLFFEYFGTGAYAEMEHIGKTSHFIESGYTEWYIPKNKVVRPLNYPTIELNGHEFYVATGTKPNHFMTDAEFKTRDKNIDIVKKKINDLIEEACK